MAQGIPPGDVCFTVGRERRGRVDEGDEGREAEERNEGRETEERKMEREWDS